jgi:hypothetical protein
MKKVVASLLLMMPLVALMAQNPQQPKAQVAPKPGTVAYDQAKARAKEMEKTSNSIPTDNPAMQAVSPAQQKAASQPLQNVQPPRASSSESK